MIILICKVLYIFELALFILHNTPHGPLFLSLHNKSKLRSISLGYTGSQLSLEVEEEAEKGTQKHSRQGPLDPGPLLWA